MNQTLERIFRILGLCYDPDDMYGAYLALQSSQKENRAAAIEFVDNVLDQDDEKFVFPIVDTMDVQTKLAKGRKLFNLSVQTYEEGMMRLLDGDDLWLKACALFSVSITCPQSLRERVSEAADDNNPPLITETARYVLQRHKQKSYENNH